MGGDGPKRPDAAGKSKEAFRTIGEVAAETGVAPHVLRYWESRFPQLRPVTRAGQRRYYRPDDVALVRRIATLLGTHGYTLRGIGQLLDAESRAPAGSREATIQAVRDLLAHALRADDRG